MLVIVSPGEKSQAIDEVEEWRRHILPRDHDIVIQLLHMSVAMYVCVYKNTVLDCICGLE